MRHLPMTTCLVLLLGACAAIPENDRALLAAEPDCANVETQIAGLEATKPSELRQTYITMQYLTPDGWVAGLIHDDFDDRRRILNGSYSDEIDTRIATIRTQCS
ncbi:hypothetical protein [Pseudaestuariivita rosea]|uniref:hypothetical protein n=1 Tax=Pseudaestuariivita rosea TaxID=2763263 RepID=UPI001ABA970D|nr:hypothetical protein [Pseudaestuariivita rosea]